jgi:hypothetical protein
MLLIFSQPIRVTLLLFYRCSTKGAADGLGIQPERIARFEMGQQYPLGSTNWMRELDAAWLRNG